MGKFKILLLLFALCSVGLSAKEVPADREQKALQDSLRRDLRDAKINTNDKTKPNFSAARKSLERAFANPYGKENPEVLLQAANTEYQCFQTERNKPASGGKMDEKVIYASTSAGFQYYLKAYLLYRHPSNGKNYSQSQKGYLLMQSNAYDLFRCTQGFRATAGYYFKQQDWKTAYSFFRLALEAIDSEILVDYANAHSEVRMDFSRFRTDSVRQRLLYSCAVTAVQMKDHVLAVKELEAAKYCGIEPNRVRQQLCREYLILNDTVGYEQALVDGANLLPNEPWYPENLLNLYLAQNDHRKALSVIDKVLHNAPGNSHNIELKAQLLDELGQVKKAEEIYQLAIAYDTTLLISYSALGRIYFNRALELENALVEVRQFDRIYSEAVPLYEMALPYYNKAFENDKERKDPSIAEAIRTILYKRFSSPKCPNAKKLIKRYNEVSKAYGMNPL